MDEDDWLEDLEDMEFDDERSIDFDDDDYDTKTIDWDEE